MTAAEASERVELAKHCSSRNWSKAIRVLDSLLAKQCSILDIWWVCRSSIQSGSVSFVIINWRRLSSLSLVPFKLISSPVPQSIDSSYSSLNHGVELWAKFTDSSPFGQAIQSNPAAGEAWKRRGQARAALGEFAEAVEDLTRALELEPKPESPDILYERCKGLYDVLLPLTFSINSGIINFRSKDFTAGVNDLSICLKQEKDNKSAYTYLGLSFASLGEYIKAEEAHLKSIQLDSNYLEAWLHLAQECEEQARKDKLKNSQKKTEEVKPESCDVEGADKGLKRRDCEDGNEVEEKEEASSKAKKPKVVLRHLQDERLIKKKKLRNQKMVLQLIHQKPLTLDLYGIGGELILRGGWMI
ncbi:hypothetical protein YC2023_009018 [Brassica napus]